MIVHKNFIRADFRILTRLERMEHLLLHMVGWIKAARNARICNL